MTRPASRSGVQGNALSNDEAAALINIILDNTDTSAPTRTAPKTSTRSLADIFPGSVLSAA